MSFTLIKGTFHVRRYSPDGDSLRFKANSAANWNRLGGRRVDRNARQHAQLRFEGVDTPETHYPLPGGSVYQPPPFSDDAADFTIAAARITGVAWGPTHGRVTQANDGTPGYILARECEKYGRPVAFVFAGSTNRADGSNVFLTSTWLRQSINYKLLKAGLAYPCYYEGLFSDLRNEMTAAVMDAWNAGRNLWPYDWSYGVPVTSRDVLESNYMVFPKLFRRLAAYLTQHGSVNGFKDHLAQDPEPVHILSTGHFTHFDNVIEQDGNRVGLTVDPEDLVFRP